jgi:hypothetical protein
VQVADDGVDPFGVDVEPHVVVVDDDVVHAGQALEVGRGRGGLRDDGGAGEVTQLIERPGLHDRALSDDRDAVAQLLDLRQDVRRQQHRAARRLRLEDAPLEDGLHQRIEPGGRLVQDQQLHVGGQSRDDGDLLPVALRVGARLLGRVEVEALDHLVTLGAVQVTPEAGEHIDGLTPGEVGPQLHVARYVCQPPVQGHRVGPGVTTQHPCLSRVGTQQPEQHPDRSRLPGAVGSEEAVDLAGSDLEVEPVERPCRAETLDQTRD